MKMYCMIFALVASMLTNAYANSLEKKPMTETEFIKTFSLSIPWEKTDSVESLKQLKFLLIKSSQAIRENAIYERNQILNHPDVFTLSRSRELIIEDIETLRSWILDIDTSKRRSPHDLKIYIYVNKITYSGAYDICSSDDILDTLDKNTFNFLMFSCENKRIALRIGVTNKFELIINRQVVGKIDPLDFSEPQEFEFKSRETGLPKFHVSLSVLP